MGAGQAPQVTRERIAERLGLPFDNVTFNVTLLGGGFGRKSKPDFVVEAAILAKEFPGKAVRVQWTREDDIHNSYFHTVSAEYLKAAVGKDGMPSGWLHRTVAPSITALFAPGMNHEAAFELGMGFTNMAYAIPNVRLKTPKPRCIPGSAGIARCRTFLTGLRFRVLSMNWRTRPVLIR